MLAIYRGKEYVCRNRSRTFDDGSRSKCWLELKSHEQDDEDFIFGFDGWYIKMVYAAECTDIRDIVTFAEYKNESIQILYRRPQELCVAANSHHIYSEEFIDVVLGGQIGRDLYSWVNWDVFTGFHFVVRDFIEDEEPRYSNERITKVSREEMEHYLSLDMTEYKKK